MPDHDGHVSNPFHPDPVEGCCEQCVFGIGMHAEWCPYHEDAALFDSFSIPESLLNRNP